VTFIFYFSTFSSLPTNFGILVHCCIFFTRYCFALRYYYYLCVPISLLLHVRVILHCHQFKSSHSFASLPHRLQRICHSKYTTGILYCFIKNPQDHNRADSPLHKHLRYYMAIIGVSLGIYSKIYVIPYSLSCSTAVMLINVRCFPRITAPHIFYCSSS